MDYKKAYNDLLSLINAPEINDFIEGVKREAPHQTMRWGPENELKKWPEDYALVLDKLKGKQAIAIWDRDLDKYKHHLITMAAVCLNIHLKLDDSNSGVHNHFHDRN